MKNRSFLLLAGLLFLVACHAPQKPEEEKSNPQKLKTEGIQQIKISPNVTRTLTFENIPI